MKCRSCGQEIDADSSFCKLCGTKVYDTGKMGLSYNEKGGFVIKDDGTIIRSPEERRDGQRESMNKEILEVIEVGACSHRFFAAFEARMRAYEICKAKYGNNYKDYVEMLMRSRCPVEYEKAEIAKKYMLCTCVTGVLLALSFSILVYFPIILCSAWGNLLFTIILSLIFIVLVLLCYFVDRYFVRNLVLLKKRHKTLCGEEMK